MKGTISVASNAAAAQPANDADKKVIFKSCTPFINSISWKNSTKVDDAYNIGVVCNV